MDLSLNPKRPTGLPTIFPVSVCPGRPGVCSGCSPVHALGRNVCGWVIIPFQIRFYKMDTKPNQHHLLPGGSDSPVVLAGALGMGSCGWVASVLSLPVPDPPPPRKGPSWSHRAQLSLPPFLPGPALFLHLWNKQGFVSPRLWGSLMSGLKRKISAFGLALLTELRGLMGSKSPLETIQPVFLCVLGGPGMDLLQFWV